MASGTAYRWDIRVWRTLTLDPYLSPYKPKPKLYKAPRNRGTKNQPPSTPFLGHFPPELLRQILFELDINSLGMLRRVNTITRNIVESLPAYVLLREHASDALRIMNATKCISYFPIRWLFDELRQPRCRTCSDFGPFLYIPTVSRSCLQCNITRPEYRVAPLTDVMFHFGVTRNTLKSIPNIYPLPGRRNTQRMIDVSQARTLGLQHHGSMRKLEQAF